MKIDENKIYESLNKKEPLKIYVPNKECLEKEMSNLNLAIKCLPLVSPINYRELQEKNPEKFAELFDIDAKRCTLAGFKEELRTLVKNNQTQTIDASKKIVKGSEQFESYEDALKEIEETSVQNANRTYAKTFNFSKANSFILIDEDITEVSNLLEQVINSSLTLQTEPVITSSYDLGNSENIQDFFE